MLTGCARYQYTLVQPGGPRLVTKEGTSFALEPLSYTFADRGHHLGISIGNNTTNAVSLQTHRSYAVDPSGASHPIPGVVVGPNSHVPIYVPPVPLTMSGWAYPPAMGYWGYPYGAYYYPYWGMGWAWPSFYGPYSYTYELRTPMDWRWNTGQVRLHLGYESAGRNFDHEFVIDREKVK